VTILKTGEWARAAEILTRAPSKLERATKQALLQEGHFFRNKIVEGLREQAPGGEPFEPLSPMTLATRKAEGFGGSKALIRRGDLRNSVSVTADGERVFVGVLRSAVGKDGRPVANIAEMNEYGSEPIVIRMTEKMRAFLAIAFREAGIEEPDASKHVSTGIIVVRIPPRPFVGPVWRKWGQPPEQVAKRFMARIAFLLDGDFGVLGEAPPSR
jgi:hypothetical protein